MIGTGIVTAIARGSGTGIENETVVVKGLEIGTVEIVGMEEEGWIGSKTIIGMEGMEAGTGTVTEVGQVPLLGTVTGGHLKVQLPLLMIV